MKKINVALLGIGNCASSLVQGVYYYSDPSHRARGPIHPQIGGHAPSDLEFVLAIDTDARKVGRDLADAIFAPPNCTTIFHKDIPADRRHGDDGTGSSTAWPITCSPRRTGAASSAPMPRRRARTRSWPRCATRARKCWSIILPVGSEAAMRFYMDCALEAGVAVVNCMPVFIASDPVWERRFQEKRLPIVGDDIKSQLGATIVHRVLANLFRQRGVGLSRTYQLNTGGNTDFMNMLDRDPADVEEGIEDRGGAVELGEPLDADDIHIGPSDYIPGSTTTSCASSGWRARLFGDVPINLELRLSVEDSPNSAAVVIDAVRCCKVALQRGLAAR